MRMLPFQVGMALMGGVALLIWGPWSDRLPNVSELMSYVTDMTEMATEAPVVVMVMRDQASVNTVRAVIEPKRILAASEDAFATAEGRIFATSIEAASEPLNLAGWANRRIEFVDVAGKRKPTFAEIQARAQAEEAAEVASETAMDALKNKDSLTRSEALELLQEMEKNGDI